MPWIESHTVLKRHRKLLTFAKALAVSPTLAVGLLHCLWHSVLDQAEDGDIADWSPEFLAEVSGYDGPPEKLRNALLRAKFLDGHLIHDWLDYAGRYLVRKYHSSQRLRLETIWKKHGRTYGAASSQSKPPAKPRAYDIKCRIEGYQAELDEIKHRGTDSPTGWVAGSEPDRLRFIELRKLIRSTTKELQNV